MNVSLEFEPNLTIEGEKENTVKRTNQPSWNEGNQKSTGDQK